MPNENKMRAVLYLVSGRDADTHISPSAVRAEVGQSGLEGLP